MIWENLFNIEKTVKDKDDTALYAVLSIIWINYLWKVYLSQRQYKFTESTRRVPRELNPIIEQNTFDEARLYSIAKQKFGMFSDFIEVITGTILIYSGAMAYFWETSKVLIKPNEGNELILNATWTSIMVGLSRLIYLNLNYYFTFFLEEKFGFNKQTFTFFIKDEIKTFVVTLLVYVPVSIIATFVVLNSGSLFFLPLWLSMGLFYLLLMGCYNAVIAPIFDQFTELPQGELREEIQNLTKQLQFPLKQIYVVNESKRSTHSNIYYTGLFNKKQIVIYDNLLESAKTDEILAILAHELSLWKYGYLTQKFILSQINLLLTSSIFSYIYCCSPFYKAIGFNNLTAGVVSPGLFFTIQYLVPLNVATSCYKNVFAKKIEEKSNVLGAKFVKTDALLRALVKTYKDNLEFPIYDDLYSSWYRSQETLLEKIAGLEARTV